MGMAGILREILTNQQFHISWHFFSQEHKYCGQKAPRQAACATPGSARIIPAAQNEPLFILK